MDQKQLQTILADMGFYDGPINGIFEPRSKGAAIACLTDGPDYPLTREDIVEAAAILRCEPWKVQAVYQVESTGSPFTNGLATILFEPHRFSRATGHRYDQSHPKISSRSWNKRLYPASQAGRWNQLMDAVALDVDAGFASASYGGFQILGENHLACGAASPWAFAWRQCQTVGDQLEAFVLFVINSRLDDELRACQPGKPDSCVPFVSRYNGTAYKQNSYDTRFADALTIARLKWK